MTRRLEVGERAFMRELARKRARRERAKMDRDARFETKIGNPAITWYEREALTAGVQSANVQDGSFAGHSEYVPARVLTIVFRPEYEARLLGVFERVLGFKPEVFGSDE